MFILAHIKRALNRCNHNFEAFDLLKYSLLIAYRGVFQINHWIASTIVNHKIQQNTER